MSWAIDIGNSHTRVARWDETRGVPTLLELPEICRQPGGDEPMAAPRLIPTATEILDPPDWKARFGRWPPIRRRFFVGRRAIIGRPALERSLGFRRPGFAPAFKPHLDREALRVLTRTKSAAYTARDVTELFLRELLREIYVRTGTRVRDLVATHPVGSFETYRAELQRATRRLGIRSLRFVDEPVAASLGYGLSVGRSRRILVIDFGAGTLDVALVVLDPKGVEEGRARVVAKEGRVLGGNDVDGWMLVELARELGLSPDAVGVDPEEKEYWRRVMLAEARRVKEALFFHSWTVFHYVPPSYLRRVSDGVGGLSPSLEISRDRLVEVLESRRLYSRLEECVDAVLESAASRHSLGEDEIDDVLMVGGSTLLPGVYPLIEERFGRDRVRAWQPFQAVALGACVLASGQFVPGDLVAHDYAFVTHDPETHEEQYTVIVPAGTRVPTDSRLWTGKLVPTCALGEPERTFRLKVCEVGRGGSGRRFVWDEAGDLHRLDGEGGEKPVVVPLNESDPTLGRLDPPHSPSDRKARLEIAFGVDAERWLKATVDDLLTGKRLLDGAKVVRLQ